MSGEGFLRRWARRKSEVREGRDGVQVAAPPAVPAAVPVAVPVGTAAATPDAAPLEPAASQPALTMDDVATLDRESDFSAFVARGVDQAVRRGALKKLFADPHFNVMDKLDVYIDDYTQPSPMSDAMLASLEHAKSVFMKLAEDAPEAAPEVQAQQQSQPPPPPPPEQETQ